MPEHADWPALPWQAWRETQATLHMWLQILGKVKLALSPLLNEWWNVAFTISARGLTSGPVPYGDGVFDMELDFLSHNLHMRTSRGGHKALPLMGRSVARFYSEVLPALASLGIGVVGQPRRIGRTESRSGREHTVAPKARRSLALELMASVDTDSGLQPGPA